MKLGLVFNCSFIFSSTSRRAQLQKKEKNEKKKYIKKGIIDIREELCLDVMPGEDIGEVKDNSEKKVEITIHNNPERTAGIGNKQVLALNGTNQMIQTDHKTYYDSNIFTALAFFSQNENKNYTLFSKKHNSDPWYKWDIGNWGDNKAYIEIKQKDGQTKNFQSQTTIENNKWYFIAITSNGVEIKMYINGEKEGEMTLTDEMMTSDGVLAMGASWVGGGLLNGKIGMFRFYEKELQEEEIKTLKKIINQKFGITKNY